MRYEICTPVSKEKAAQVLEETFSALRAEFDERFQGVTPDAAVSHGGRPAIEHVNVSGLPRFRASSHASVGNGHVQVAAVVGTKVPCDNAAGVGICKASQLVSGGVRAQTYRCFQIIEQVLRVCNAQWGDLVRLTVYMPDLGEDTLEALEQAVGFFFQERGCTPVAISVVGCAQLIMAAAVQIEGMAVKHSEAEELQTCSETCPIGARCPKKAKQPASSFTIPCTAETADWRSGPGAEDAASTAASTDGVPACGQSSSSVGHGKSRESSPKASAPGGCRPGPPQPHAFGPGDCWGSPPPRNGPSARLSRAKSCSHHPSSQGGPEQVARGRPGTRSGVAGQGRGASAPEENLEANPAEQGEVGQESDVSETLRWLLQGREEKSASTLAAEAPGARLAPAPPAGEAAAAPAMSVMEDGISTPETDDLSKHLGLTGRNDAPADATEESTTDAGEPVARPRFRRTWVQKPKAPAANSPADAFFDAAPPSHRDRGCANLRERSPLTGHEPSLQVEELSLQHYRESGLGFQPDHNMLWKIRIEVSDSLRIARLGPGELICKQQQQLAGCKQVWSYTFDVLLAHTVNSFVNVGLVEWIASAKDEPLAECPVGAARSGEAPLSELLGVASCDTRGAPFVRQHASNCPRQWMLGCRKGVKWYGSGNSSSEPVFRDDFCQGSLLHFRCDYTLNAEGAPVQVRLWLLPSPVIFRRQGRQVTQLSNPLFEFQLPPVSAGASPDQPPGRSVWVPAVSMFSQHDEVLLAWRGIRSRGDWWSKHRAGPRPCQPAQARI